MSAKSKANGICWHFQATSHNVTILTPLSIRATTRAFSGLPAGCQASGTDYHHRGAKWYVTLGSHALLSTIVRRCNPVPPQARIRDNLQAPTSADPLSQGTEWPSQFRHRE